MMKEQSIGQRLDEGLMWLNVSEQQHNALFDAITKEQVPETAFRNKPGYRVNLRLAVVLVVLVVSLGAAVAEGLASMVFSWLQARPDAARLNSGIALNYTPVEYTLRGVTFICNEAMADDRSFAVTFTVKSGDSNHLLLSDQKDNEITDQDTQSIYVNAEPFYQGKDSEIAQVEFDDDGQLCLLYEGWYLGEQCTEMEVALTVIEAGQTYEEVISVPVIWLPAIEDAVLTEPIRIGDTGYTLTSLSLHRTEWRTYLDYSFSIQDQPLVYAVKRPDIVLCDVDSNAIGRYWPYEQSLPDTLYIQVWDDAHTEKLYEQALYVSDITAPNNK